MRFTIKKTLAFMAMITLATHAGPCLDDIPNASYAIFEGGKEPGLRLLRVPNKNVTFYTFDGNSIITVPLNLAYHCYWKAMSLRLDPNAPKPQPVTYEIKPVSKMHGLLGSGKSIIFFYDKHDNVIQQYECYKKGNTIEITFPNPDVKPGRIGARWTFGAPNFEMLRELATTTLKQSLPIDLSRVTEKQKKSKK